jgi:hypothetical protein
VAVKIAEIWRYPVKTMAGEQRQRVAIGPLGIAGDRVVHVEDARGRVITSRSHPRLPGHQGSPGARGKVLVDHRRWDSPDVAADVVDIAGPGARLVRDEGAERFDVLPLLVEQNRDLGNRVRYALVLFILASGIPVRTPSPATVPQGDRGPAELRRLWDESQRWLRLCIAALGPGAGRKAVFEHPIAGLLTVSQAVRLGQVHVDGHVRQMRRLRRLLA